MRIILKILAGLAIVALLAALAAWLFLPSYNDRQTNGELSLAGLSSEVRVIRDERGTPYIYADNLADAVRAHGQDDNFNNHNQYPTQLETEPK